MQNKAWTAWKIVSFLRRSITFDQWFRKLAISEKTALKSGDGLSQFISVQKKTNAPSEPQTLPAKLKHTHLCESFKNIAWEYIIHTCGVWKDKLIVKPVDNPYLYAFLNVHAPANDNFTHIVLHCVESLQEKEPKVVHNTKLLTVKMREVA